MSRDSGILPRPLLDLHEQRISAGYQEQWLMIDDRRAERGSDIAVISDFLRR